MKIILVEGIDGTGKTTACMQLRYELIKHNYSCKIQREPDGIFRELLERDLNSKTKLMLYLASRAELCERLKSETSDFVILDRFTPSTLCYQQEFNFDFLLQADEIVRNNVRPDFTFLFELDFDLTIERIELRDKQEVSLNEQSYLLSVKQRYKEAIEKLGWNYEIYQPIDYSFNGMNLFNKLIEKEIIV